MFQGAGLELGRLLAPYRGQVWSPSEELGRETEADLQSCGLDARSGREDERLGTAVVPVSYRCITNHSETQRLKTISIDYCS